ncbi:lasso peptide biosynthesis B2 protein [Streptomyces sp. NPDC093085]|uniref:lasso peptide biosynthesis B2 protein n=1 Tax=Streptomyces sp. NPDC093085 TaxID=3155068 RepID=UPI0034248ADC
MSIPFAPESRVRLPLRQRTLPLIAVVLAFGIARLPPRRIRTLLHLARRGARSATAEQALAARRAVVAVSARCAGEGCLPRSLATALLCRARGVWPTWCTGVRTDPFRAHAWVEAEGRPVGEPPTADHYHPIMTVPVRAEQP